MGRKIPAMFTGGDFAFSFSGAALLPVLLWAAAPDELRSDEAALPGAPAEVAASYSVPVGAQAEADGLPASPAPAAQDAVQERRVVPSAERYAPEAPVAVPELDAVPSLDAERCAVAAQDAAPGDCLHPRLAAAAGFHVREKLEPSAEPCY